MKQAIIIATAIAILLTIAIEPCTADEKAAAKATPVKRPLVEVAFVLDTTGSMSGLIEGAKRKIWFIANQIVLGKPRPDLRIALVPYRDKGDEYVTKVYDLTDNIDEVYKNLSGFRAAGGGDGPENVNQALHDAVYKLSWSKDKDRRTLKIIYLVGDCPPHNEYKDVPTYDKIAYAAINKKGIYVNTVLCGSNSQARKVWQEIARMAEGTFAQIDQGGGVSDIATPYDGELAKLNAEPSTTAVYYGRRKARNTAREMTEAAATTMPDGAAADRATYMSKGGEGKASTIAGRRGKGGGPGVKDLVDEVRDGKVDLSKLKAKHLPENMQKMTPAAQKAYIAKQQVRRDEILRKITALSTKRAAHVKKQLAETEGDKAKKGFDYKVVEALRIQAARKNIKYKSAANDD